MPELTVSAAITTYDAFGGVVQKQKINWLPVEGSAEVSESGISFTGVKPKVKADGESDDLETKPARRTTVLRSDTYFETGDITGEVKISNPQMRVHFRLGATGDSRTTIGFNVLKKTYGLGTVFKDEVKEISTAGDGTKIATNQWIKFRIRVRGSQLEFFINDIRVIQGTINISRAQLEVYLGGEGTVELRNVSVEAMRPQAFVVMQFTAEYTALYKEVIEPVCSSFGYQVIRGDNVYTNGLIIEDITRSIRECSIVIADITPNNANVYYELGYAHGIGKPAILLSDRSRDKLPFDISGFRLLFYDNTIGGKSAVEDALRKHLEAIRGA